jgi:hypothetical protein
VAFNTVNLDDAKVVVEQDKIDAALGHPRSANHVALSGLNLARSEAQLADSRAVTWDDAEPSKKPEPACP